MLPNGHRYKGGEGIRHGSELDCLIPGQVTQTYVKSTAQLSREMERDVCYQRMFQICCFNVSISSIVLFLLFLLFYYGLIIGCGRRLSIQLSLPVAVPFSIKDGFTWKRIT